MKRFFFLREKEMVQTPYYVIINFLYGVIYKVNFYEYLLDILNTECSDDGSPNALAVASLPMFTKKPAFLCNNLN